MKSCDRCHRTGNDKIHIVLRDAIGEKTLCLSCMALSFLEGELSFVNDQALIDDISGKPGAVEFKSTNERYCLEKQAMMRLLSYNLKRHEYLILADKYGRDKFMLRNDVYWYDDNYEVIV